LDDGCDPVGSGRDEQRWLAGGIRRSLQHKHIRHAPDLDGNVEAHGEHEHLAILSRLTSAPSVAVRGKNSSSPPSTSAAPSMISYGCEMPTCSHSSDAELVPPDPTGNRFKRHHLPHDGLVGKPSTDDTGADERDLRVPQAEQPEVDEAESKGDSGDRRHRGRSTLCSSDCWRGIETEVTLLTNAATPMLDSVINPR
jgi:hypothetical protein